MCKSLRCVCSIIKQRNNCNLKLQLFERYKQEKVWIGHSWSTLNLTETIPTQPSDTGSLRRNMVTRERSCLLVTSPHLAAGFETLLGQTRLSAVKQGFRVGREWGLKVINFLCVFPFAATITTSTAANAAENVFGAKFWWSPTCLWSRLSHGARNSDRERLETQQLGTSVRSGIRI